MDKVAYLNKTDDKVQEKKLEEVFGECLQFDSLSNLFTTKHRISVIAVSCSKTDDLLSCMKRIRQSDRFFLTPVILEDAGDNDFLFADGYFSELDKALKDYNKIDKLIQLLKGRDVDRWKSKLLSYLFTRPNLVITPIADWKNRLYYTYPLLDLFCTNIENYFYWLDDLCSDGLLSVENLIDQVFCCPFCLSAHMKFTDHCPNCNSINIRKENFLHCFTCGLVAPQSEFMKNDRYVCPRCNSKLKHIGDDYDRPLENGVCNDCNFYYMDTVLVAKCMICDKNYPAESLIKRAFHEYKLTDTGKNYIRNNSIDINTMFSDSNNYVNQQYFYSTLDWMILMQQRYAEDFFSILGFNFHMLMDEFDYERIHDFAEHLRRMLRTTDFCTRLSENIFWIILTKTDTKHTTIVKNRIEETYKKLLHDKSEKELEIVQFNSSQKNIKEENAKALIAKLGSEL
jgi:transcription initiation factor TFIIIB Brf1 subunit/transcription initiation factor TFIIB